MIEDYATAGANLTDLIEPFKGRVLRTLEFFDGTLLVSSGYRSYSEQVYLWNLYGPPRAARPGFSKHETGEAVDFHLTGSLTWSKVHAGAAMFGLHFPLDYEDWHSELDPAWVPAPEPPEDDMNKQETAEAFGCTIAPEGDDFAGKICVPLAVDRDGKLTGEFKLYPLGVALSYTHQELKMARLAGR